jgi:nicotinic acid mononucleotide adenylyltransferase
MANGGPKEKVILCLGGAFNPVHSRHVMAMVLGKQWLEANTNYQVIAGRLVVAPDGYVKAKSSKSGCKCIKAEHRIKMCELACYPYKEWLATITTQSVRQQKLGTRQK